MLTYAVVVFLTLPAGMSPFVSYAAFSIRECSPGHYYYQHPCVGFFLRLPRLA